MSSNESTHLRHVEYPRHHTGVVFNEDVSRFKVDVFVQSLRIVSTGFLKLHLEIVHFAPRHHVLFTVRRGLLDRHRTADRHGWGHTAGNGHGVVAGQREVGHFREGIPFLRERNLRIFFIPMKQATWTVGTLYDYKKSTHYNLRFAVPSQPDADLISLQEHGIFGISQCAKLYLINNLSDQKQSTIVLCIRYRVMGQLHDRQISIRVTFRMVLRLILYHPVMLSHYLHSLGNYTRRAIFPEMCKINQSSVDYHCKPL